MKSEKVKLVVLNFSQTVIEQDLNSILTKHNLSHPYYNPNPDTYNMILCSNDDNFPLRNLLYNDSVMNKLIDKLFKENEITVKNPQDFKTLIKELQTHNISFAISTESDRIDEVDYILKKLIGINHNFIIIAGDNKNSSNEKIHVNKVIEKINSSNQTYNIQPNEVVLIDNEITKGTTKASDNSTNHCSAIQVKPGEVVSGLQLLLNYLNTGETHIDLNPSHFYFESPTSSELSGQGSSLNT